MLPTALPQHPDTAELDVDAPDSDVDVEAPPREEPKLSSQTPLKVLEGHTMGVEGLAFFPDSRRLISGSWDRTVIIWDITSREVEKKLTAHTDWVRSVAVAPDGSVFASGSDDKTLRVWDGTTGNQIGGPIAVGCSGHRGVWGVSFSEQGQRVAATGGGTVRIWDVQTQALITGPLPTSWGVSYATIFSPDGNRIAADAGGGGVRVWDSVDGKVIFDSLKGHKDHVRCTAFTPDGQQLVTASLDNTICRWDMRSGALIGIPLTGHSDSIFDGVLFHDGQTLATASADSTVRFWDLKTGNQKSCLLQHQSSVWCVALSCDGSLLATGCQDGKVYLWDMKAIEVEFVDESKHEDDESETSSTERWLDTAAVRSPLAVAEGAGAGVTNYDHESEFWGECDRAGPSDATGKGKEKADDEDKFDSPSQRRIFKRLKRFGQSLKPSKKSKDGHANAPPEASGVPENSSRASPHASSMVSDPSAVVEPAPAHRASEEGRGVDTLHPPSTSVLPSRRLVSKFARPRASWKSHWDLARRQQPDIVTVYSCKADDRHVAAADPSQPSQVPERWETALGDYPTHSVIPFPPTPTDDDHDNSPNENPDVHTPGAFCGLCSKLFSRPSTPRPNDLMLNNSGVEMAELRRRPEDERTSATAASTRPAMSTGREQIKHRSAHDTAIALERLRIEEAAASRAHELLILDRQIELARIRAASPTH